MLSDPRPRTVEINQDSLMYRAATAAGWKFAPARVEPYPADWKDVKHVLVRGAFTCVCGKHELYATVIPCESPLFQDARFDAAEFLHQFGSFSPEHLRQDGYTEQEIQRITRQMQAVTHNTAAL